MEEKNPLRSNLPKSELTVFNRSGRPTNKDLIKFGPQPKSFVSEMLQKFKKECDNSVNNSININPVLKPEKCIEPKNHDAHNSKYIEITVDLDLESAKVEKKCKEKNIKLYLCDFPNCTYACKLSSNLVKHKRIHTSEKPYLCHQCSFRSNFVNSLKAHQRIHTAEKPYGCNYCSYRCNSSSNLKKHCKHRHSTEAQNSEQINNIDLIT